MLWILVAVAVLIALYLIIRRHGALGFWKIASKHPYTALAMFEEQDCWFVFTEKPSGGYRSALPPGDWAGPFKLLLPWSPGNWVTVFGRVPDYEDSQRAFVELMTKTLVAEPWRALEPSIFRGDRDGHPGPGAPANDGFGVKLAREAILTPPAGEPAHAVHLDRQWTELLDSVKTLVNASPDANMDNGELCWDTWECYAFCRWTNNPDTGLYESSLVDPACAAICRDLSESEVAALLTWQWSEYLDLYDPGVESPAQMPPEARRAALADVLREAVYIEAMSDGAAVEERQVAGDVEGPDMGHSEMKRNVEAKLDGYAGQVIRHLEEYPQEALLSGEGSPMENTWEEWVAQVRGEHSIYYDLYEHTVRGICDAVAASIPQVERATLWPWTDASDQFEEGEMTAEDEAVCALADVLYARVNHIAENMKLPKRLEEYLHPSAD